MKSEISIVSLNVRGINDVNKRNSVYTWLKENKYDVCLLQETFCTNVTRSKYDKTWKGESIHSLSNSSHSRGVSVLLNQNLTYKIISSHSDNDGRVILVNLEINDNEYKFVCAK